VPRDHNIEKMVKVIKLIENKHKVTGGAGANLNGL